MAPVYPLLAQLPPAATTLSVPLRTILLAAGHVAAADVTSLLSSYAYIPSSLHPKAYELTIVQAAPMVGVPKVLHSASALQHAGIVGLSHPNSPHSPSNATPVADLRRAGEQTFDAVYGRNTQRVRQRLAAFHPGLEHWITSAVYGWAFQSNSSALHISLRERELVNVALLAVDPCASVQLASHIRGAILAGATAPEVETVIHHTAVTHKPAADTALAVWQTYHRARYAL